MGAMERASLEDYCPVGQEDRVATYRWHVGGDSANGDFVGRRRLSSADGTRNVTPQAGRTLVSFLEARGQRAAQVAGAEMTS